MTTSRLRSVAVVVWVWVLRGRYLALGLAGGGWTLFETHRAGQINDWLIFEYGARVLTVGGPHYRGGALHLYANNPNIQIGPPPLLAVGGLQWLSPHAAMLVGSGLMLVLALVAIAAVERAALIQRGQGERDRIRAAAFVGGLIVLVPWGPLAGLFHHLDDAMALAGLSLAYLLCVRGRPWWGVPLLLGFAATCKPWAIVGIPLLLVLPRARRAPALLLVIGQVAAWWAPFQLADRRTLSEVSGYHVLVQASATLHELGLYGERSPGWQRPVQLGIAVALGALAVRRGRWQAVLLLALLARWVTDPGAYSYYAAGPVLGALAWDLSVRGRRWPITTGLVMVLTIVPSAALSGAVGGSVTLGGSVLLVLYVLVRRVPEAPATPEDREVAAIAIDELPQPRSARGSMPEPVR